MTPQNSNKNKTNDIVFIALFAVLIVVCSYIHTLCSSVYYADLCGLSDTELSWCEEGYRIDFHLSVPWLDRRSGLFEFQFRNWSTIWSNGRIYARLALIRSCDGAVRKAAWH